MDIKEEQKKGSVSKVTLVKSISREVKVNPSNHNSQENIARSQLELEVKSRELPEAREKASDQVAIVHTFESGWSRKWRKFSGPILYRNKAKPKQSWITFDTELKIALL